MEKIWAVNQINKNTAEIRLYGYIGSDKVNASVFVDELKTLELKYQNINLRINSGGGSIFEGIAIFNAIKNSTANIDAYVDGLAASMASVIILACRKIYMSKIAMLMTHRPSGAAMGNPDQLRSTAGMLEDLESIVSSVYSDRTGLTTEEVKAKYLGTSDNWMTASEALQAKIIDGIYDSPKAAAVPPATMRAEQDLVNYFTNSFESMKQIILTAPIMAVLGIDATAEDSVVQDALNQLAAKAAKVDTLTTQLQTVEAENATLKTQDADAKAIALVDKAVSDKKIPAVEKDKYLRLAKADFEGTEAVVNSMKAFTGIQGMLDAQSESANAELAQISKMTANEIWKAGKFERLKQLSPEVYKAKYEEFVQK